MVSIQYVSDLHLEFRGNKYKNLFRIVGDILCLAGDICVCANPEDFEILVNFLNYICPQYKHVIHITGNHEYYTAGVKKITENNTMEAVDKLLKRLEGLIPNYHFLNCDLFELKINKKKYIFCGATLWANVSEKDKKVVESYMNDYKNI